MTTEANIAIRAKIFHFIARDQYEFFDDGLLIVSKGLVSHVGFYSELSHQIPGNCLLIDEREKWLFPGFIDGHIHSVQTQVMASYGADLLQWLSNYTFPAEELFADEAYAKKEIAFFFSQLLKNGTTTAAIYTSVHAESLRATMNRANELNMRILAGKTNMDRNAPASLCEDTDLTFSEAEELILEFDNKKRLNYILTPRFAITSTPSQLEQLGQIKARYPQVRIQTHISENREEIEQTLKLFPDSADYLAVYESFGLVDSTTVLGHAIHLSPQEWERVQNQGATLVHCPTSNLFLGSGLFDLKKAWDINIPLCLGSDIGGGYSFSMLQTAAAAYQIAALRGEKFDAFQLFYLLTLGGAKALGLDHKIGNFETGKEADFILLNPRNLPLLTQKLSSGSSLHEVLFSFIFLGSEQLIDSVYLMGSRVV